MNKINRFAWYVYLGVIKCHQPTACFWEEHLRTYGLNPELWSGHPVCTLDLFLFICISVLLVTEIQNT